LTGKLLDNTSVMLVSPEDTLNQNGYDESDFSDHLQRTEAAGVIEKLSNKLLATY
jgi:hypothetical protein